MRLRNMLKEKEGRKEEKRALQNQKKQKTLNGDKQCTW